MHYHLVQVLFNTLCFTVLMHRDASVLAQKVTAGLHAHYTTHHPACSSLMYIYEVFLQ